MTGVGKDEVAGRVHGHALRIAGACGNGTAGKQTSVTERVGRVRRRKTGIAIAVGGASLGCRSCGDAGNGIRKAGVQ